MQARKAFHWFLGDNDLRTPLYDFTTGGCRDGLEVDTVNENQGAESTLAWLMSLLLMHDLQTELALGAAATPTNRLIAALNLVRGRPLADAPPTQWHWLEPALVGITATIRRAGAELADRALAADDLDLARWAIAQAATCGYDENLLSLRLKLERRAGHEAEVNRLASQLWRRTTRAGLTPHADTLELLQEVADRGPRLAFSGQLALW